MGAPKAAKYAKEIKADPSRLKKSLSPGVVSIRKIPRRGACGALIAQIVITNNAIKIQIKNIAVGVVHAIQDKFIILPYTLPRDKPLAM